MIPGAISFFSENSSSQGNQPITFTSFIDHKADDNLLIFKSEYFVHNQLTKIIKEMDFLM